MHAPACRRTALAALAGTLLLPSVFAAEPGPPPAAPAPAEERRVVYVTEAIRNQIRDEVREEVLAKAQAEGWAAPHQVPAWLQRLQLHGDVRARFERTDFPSANAAGGEFPDFAAINAGSPFDVNFVDLSGERYLNVDRDRSRLRLRARLGLDAEVAPWLTTGVRLASGENASPVSTNQTLGGGNGSFGKYGLWLDRAFVRLSIPMGLASGFRLEVGRFESPFHSTPLTWSENVNFDGAAAAATLALGGRVQLRLAGGAFPLFSTGFAYPAERTQKLPGREKWLFAGQAGAAWEPGSRFRLRLGAAFYDYYGVEGRASGPCDTHLKNVTCDTDDTRATSAQKGNSYMALRTPSSAALVAESAGLVSRWQYFGLATPFRELAGTVRLEVWPLEQLRAALDAEVVRNLAFSRSRLQALALNNLAACDAAGCNRFAGGRDAWLGRFTLGGGKREARWSWTAFAEARRIESDAVLDAVNDSDFGMGGTNLKGFAFGATLAVAEQVVASARYASADAIAGPRYQVDLLQVDLTARF